jgi:benzoyl-CoA-dihydrodiol lyase
MSAPQVEYRTDPSQYKHIKLSFDGAIAQLAIDIDEDGGIRPGYKLKLNSYDLGVDIELHDALQRIRFEHPEVRTVVVTSARTASSAPAPTSSCWACRPTPGR